MKIKELKKIINNMPDDVDIILSCDGEGNNFSPLASYSSPDHVIYIPESTWSGEVYNINEVDDDDLVNGQAAFVLYPTN